MCETSWAKALLLEVGDEARRKLNIIQNAFSSHTRSREEFHRAFVTTNSIVMCWVGEKPIVRDHKLGWIKALKRWISETPCHVDQTLLKSTYCRAARCSWMQILVCLFFDELIITIEILSSIYLNMLKDVEGGGSVAQVVAIAQNRRALNWLVVILLVAMPTLPLTSILSRQLTEVEIGKICC